MPVNINKYQSLLLIKTLIIILFFNLQFSFNEVFAQDEKVAIIKLSFREEDSIKTCIATVYADSKPVVGTEVHFYVKSLFGLLPVGDVIATDENGVAAIEFPTDLPGDKNQMLQVIAKIEDDENYDNTETTAEVKWGGKLNSKGYHLKKRSLSASRENAPLFLIFTSIVIIGIIWITIFYLFWQLVMIKKSGRSIIERKQVSI